jgi:hypothetical protein
MDSLITAAARALATGNPLNALNFTALRDDAPALTLRGIAMAQLGDLSRAKTLLRRAALQAFDGRHLYQTSGDRIQKVDPATGRVVTTIPTPEGGVSGMAWAEGTLWVGQHRKCKIHRVDPETGAILRTIESNRFVTGVTWVDGMSGLESNGSDTFFCGGGSSGKVRAVRRPTRGSAAKPQN